MSRMFFLRLLLLVLLSAATLEAQADGFWRALKNWVDSADIKGCDTTYLHLPKEGFIGYGNVYLTGTNAYLTYDQGMTELGTATVSGRLHTRVTTLFSAGISYRGWGLSYSKDLSKHGDTEWSFCSYGQGYGLETRIHKSTTLSGTLDVELDGIEEGYKIRTKNSRHRLVLGNFSLEIPAAFPDDSEQQYRNYLKEVMNEDGIEPSQGLLKELFHFATTLMLCLNIDLFVTDGCSFPLKWCEDEFYGKDWRIQADAIPRPRRHG